MAWISESRPSSPANGRNTPTGRARSNPSRLSSLRRKWFRARPIPWIRQERLAPVGLLARGSSLEIHLPEPNNQSSGCGV